MIDEAIDEVIEILDRRGVKLISCSLMDPSKADGDNERFLFIHRLTEQDLLEMSKGQVKH
jgi:hypothetical protein